MSESNQRMLTDKPASQDRPPEPGYCSACATSMQGIKDEISKPDHPRTSDFFYTCNLPAKFEHPHWFNGYGSQKNRQHPMYTTTSNDYGWYPPGFHSVCAVYYPSAQKFSNRLAAAGMYRNYSLNTGMDD